MLRIHKLLGATLILLFVTLSVVPPAYAFDGRGGQKVTILAGDVVNDDLYVGANELVMDGTVNGDVVAAGQSITVNGVVRGNLVAAAQTVVINGTVLGDILTAGSVIFIGEKSTIGGDIIGAGYSVELRKGSTVGRDAVLAAGQILLAANVTRNVKGAAAALEIAGTVGGDVSLAVGDAHQAQGGPPPTMFMRPSIVPVPFVKGGLTVDPAASIEGNLEYTQYSDLSFPAGVVHGQITRIVPPADADKPTRQTTALEKTGAWALSTVRSLVTLILLGLFLLWAVPALLQSPSDKLRSKTWPSLGWGVVAYAGFFFLVLLTLFVMILGAIIFGLLTLGGLSGTMIWLGLLALFVLILGFVLATSFGAKIVFGMTLGKWLLHSVHSPLAENRFWPMAIGVAITVGTLALLTFPLIPGFLGGLLNFAVILFGLGAFWLWARERFRRQPVAVV